MAVNLGDVVFDDGDVFGDGVNVAARLEGLAPAGGVVVSGAAYDLLKNQIHVQYQPLGKKKLKNIATPVRVYSVLTAHDAAQSPLKSPRLKIVSKYVFLVFSVCSLLGLAWYSLMFERTKSGSNERLERMISEGQEALEQAGYLTDFDRGQIGVNTRKALSEFQADNGLEQTGVLSEKTAEALGIPVRLKKSDWEEIQSNKRKALHRQPEIFEILSEDDRLTRAAKSLEGFEFAFGYFDDNLYLAIAPVSGVPWSEAIEIAKRTGGYLTSISSREENDFVFELSSKDAKFWRRSDDGHFWIGPGIGLYQEDGSEEPAGGWRWLNGEEVAYTNWAFTQPNNWGGFNEKTATFYSNAREVLDGDDPSYGSTWNDERIWFYSFVVEIE